MKKHISILVCSIFIVGLLAACGNDEDKSEVKQTTEESSETSNADTGSENEKSEEPAEETTTETNSAESSDDILTELDIDTKKEKLRPQVLDIIGLYANAIKTGDTKPFHSYIDEHIINENLDTPFDENLSSKNGFDRKIESVQSSNDEATLEQYANELLTLEADDIEIRDVRDTEYNITFIYEFEAESFIGKSSVRIIYSKLDNGTFVLEEIAIW